MNDIEINGGCYCGAIRFRAKTKPNRVSTCYCEHCTHIVGSTVTVWADFPTDKFEFTKGKPVYYKRSPDHPVSNSFCGKCGSSLGYHYANGKAIDIATATLNEPNAFPATVECPNSADRPAWINELVKKDIRNRRKGNKTANKALQPTACRRG